MAAGLKIYNTSNTVQIDESYRNACLVTKIPIYLSHNIGNAYVDVPVAGTRTLMLMESANYVPALFNTTFDGSTWTYRWVFRYLGGSFPVGDTAYAWVFDYLNSPPAGTVGLKVYNAAGETVFHTDAKPLKIVSVQNHAAGFIGTPGRKYIPLVMLAPFRTVTAFPQVFAVSRGLRSNGNVITPDDVEFGPTVVAPEQPGIFAAVDVTYY